MNIPIDWIQYILYRNAQREFNDHDFNTLQTKLSHTTIAYGEAMLNPKNKIMHSTWGDIITKITQLRVKIIPKQYIDTIYLSIYQVYMIMVYYLAVTPIFRVQI